MKLERLLIEKLNQIYSEIELSDEGKVIFETGVGVGITFAMTNMVNPNIDLTILANYDKKEE